MASIPIVLVGKLPIVADTMSGLLLPEIDVVHVCHNIKAAKAEIPSLLRGETTIPVSCLGSNMTRAFDDQRIPAVVIVGGAFSDSDLEILRLVEGAEKVPWLKSNPTILPPAGPPPNPGFPKWAVERIKNFLVEHGIGLENEKFEGRLFIY